MSVLDQLMQEIRDVGGQRSYGGGNGIQMQRAYREKAQQALLSGGSPSTPSTPYNHGPGGLFGTPGLERDIISTRVAPYGLASELPARGSIVTNPLYPYLSGFGLETGTNPNGVCDDAMEAGPMSGCIQTAQFGRFAFQTRTLDIARNGQQMNRGEFLDLRIYNDPLFSDTGNGITAPSVDGTPSLTHEVLSRFVEVGVSFQNKLTRALYTGNPANNTAGGGYQEFPGLDILVGTGKYDALTAVRCPNLDSDIKDFAYQRMDQTGTQIVNIMSYLMRTLTYRADHMNLAPCDWSIVMRPEAWWELTAVWPCAYMTYRCQALTGANQTLVVDANDNLRMRDEMRNGMFLLIDGVRYPVILDTGITENTSTTTNKLTNTVFSSDIYVIPRIVRGGLVSTYWEYLDFSQTAMIALADGSNGQSPTDFWTDGGRYLWHRKPPANRCIQWQAWIEPRVRLLTPQLAGRVTNVAYQPLQHTIEPYNNEPYFVTGGVNSRVAAPLYSDWAHVGVN